MEFNKNVLILGLSDAVSRSGNWITFLAIQSIIVFKGSGTVFDSSMILIASFFPMMIFSPLSGKIVDRYPKKPLMIASQLCCGVLIIFMAVFQEQRFIIPLVTACSVISSIMEPAKTACIPEILNGTDQYEKANAVMNQFSSLSKIGGPVLAGFVIGILGPYRAMLLDAISYVLSAVLLCTLPSTAGIGSSILRNSENKSPVESSIHIVTSSHNVFLLFVTTFVSAVLVISVDVLGPVYTRDILEGGEFFFGLWIGFVGLGNMIGAFWIVMRKKKKVKFNTLAISLFFIAILPFTLGMIPALHPGAHFRWIVLPASLTCGIGVSIYMIQRTTLLQMNCPHRMLGAVSGLLESTMTAGFIAGFIGIPFMVPAFIAPGGYFILCTLALLGLILYMIVIIRRYDLTDAAAWRYRSGKRIT